MNDREAIKRAMLQDFGPSGTNGTVVCLTGPWGCGKTHLWKEIAEDLQRHNIPTCYVSLFGLSSPEEAKAKLLNSMWARQADQEKPGGLLQKAKQLGGKHADKLPVAMQLFDKKVGVDVLSRMADLTWFVPSGTVVCFDDLERISDLFRVEDALGLINYLAEQRGCRALVVMNEEHLDERYQQRAKIIASYRERIARRYLRITPDLRAVFDNLPSAKTTKPSAETKEIILTIFGKSGVKNIRTLSRALENVGELSASLGSAPEPEDVAFVTALTVEHAGGAIKGKDFYDFNHISAHFFRLKDEPNENDIEHTNFYDKFYGEDTPHYRYTYELYRLVVDGYMNHDSYAQTVYDRRKPPEGKFEKLWAPIEALDFSDFSDAEAIAWMADAVDVMRTVDGIKARHIHDVYRVAKSFAEVIYGYVPNEIQELTENLLVEAARKFDTSLHKDKAFARSRDKLMDTYQQALDQALVDAHKQEVLDAVFAQNAAELRRLHKEHYKDTLAALLDPAILPSFHFCQARNRPFYFSTLQYFADEAKYEQSLNLKLARYLALCLFEAPSMDKLDVKRVLSIYQKLIPDDVVWEGHAGD